MVNKYEWHKDIANKPYEDKTDDQWLEFNAQWWQDWIEKQWPQNSNQINIDRWFEDINKLETNGENFDLFPEVQ